MVIVWPCRLSVERYLAAGRDVEVPRPDCPHCTSPMWFWSGYERFIRTCATCVKMWVCRARCSKCQQTHSLLPSFTLQQRLDVVSSIGAVLSAVTEGAGGVRPEAERLGVPHSTARGWVRRFGERAPGWAAGFCALVVRGGGEVADLSSGTSAQQALQAITSAFDLVRPNGPAEQLWPFASVVTGGGLLATNTNPPFLVIGNRRFIAPVPKQPG